MDGGVSGCMSGQMTGGWINGRTKESGRNGEFGERWGRGDLSGTYGSEADCAVRISHRAGQTAAEPGSPSTA